jgi:hypothetical protein
MNVKVDFWDVGQEEYLTGQAGVVILMRDEQNPIPTDRHGDLGGHDGVRSQRGHLVLVPRALLADFEALIRLRREIHAGTVRNPDGFAAATTEVIRFMETGFKSSLVDCFRGIVARPT